MREWTDKDYAQAAIDMLPDAPEEIGTFLKVHRVPIPNYRTSSPISGWVRRWTDTDVVVSSRDMTHLVGGNILHPPAVREYLNSL